MHMQGLARDLLTPEDGSAPVVIAEDSIDVFASPMREIMSIVAAPPRPRIGELVGKRAGGHLRAAIAETLPDERDAGSPLYLLVDDLAGASLVAGWAWSRWSDDWMVRAKQEGTQSTAGRRGKMDSVCIGFAPGSSALNTDGSASPLQSSTPVEQLEHPLDPTGWHRLTTQEGVGMRRARRIDLWREVDVVRIDAMFQDSATSPTGNRIAVHEYSLTASADVASHRLRDVRAVPRILPYAECPGAAANVGRLVGEPLVSLRSEVLRILSGSAGCTHLNDALRALAEVPRLVGALERAVAAPFETAASAPHV